MEDENVALPGGCRYFAEHFGHKKYNFIWKMPSVLLEESLTVDLEGQQQWPEDVKLYQPIQESQILLPDYANCLAVQAFLRMNKLKFEIIERHNAEFMSPSGRVPFIKCGAFLVSEFESIVSLVNKKGMNICERLSNEEYSDMRAYMSLANHMFLNAELYMCWCDEIIYQNITWPRYGSIFTWPLNYIVTWQKRNSVKKKLAILEWGNKKLNEVLKSVQLCCMNLSLRLENSEYFFGDRPTELDALVFGHIFSIVTTLLPRNELANIVNQFPNLIDLCRRIEKKYFQT